MSAKRESAKCVVTGHKVKKVEDRMHFLFHNLDDLFKKSFVVETKEYQALGFTWKLRLLKRGPFRVEVQLYGADNVSAVVACVSYPMDNDPTWVDQTTQVCKGVHLTFDRVNPYRELGKIYNWDSSETKIEVDLRMRIYQNPVWYPKPLQRCPLVKGMMDSGKFSDIAFTVHGKTFHCHKFILDNCAQQLVQMGLGLGSETTIDIDRVEAETFEQLIRYIYKGETPNDLNETGYKKLLSAANYSACIHLKVQLESEIIDGDIVSADNAADWSNLADDYTLPYIKEHCMTILAHRPSASIDDVASLREQLEKKGLSVDGSIETLKTRLEQAD